MSLKVAGYFYLLAAILFQLVLQDSERTNLFLIMAVILLCSDEIVKEIRECKKQISK